MNYLAHLFLAAPEDEYRIGSILADFTMGTIDDLRGRYGDKIACGIRHHRDIDRFTDSHPVVAHSVDALRGDYSAYSGIIVDVVFDHFLLKYWERFSTIPAETFMDAAYRSLDCWDWEFPPRYQRVIAHLVEKQWLDSYRQLENVAYALARVGERFPRETPLDNTLPGLRGAYDLLEADFLSFFPELMTFAAANNCDGY